jgi:hypothetical protein
LGFLALQTRHRRRDLGKSLQFRRAARLTPAVSDTVTPRSWLEQALPTLIAAADVVPADGDDLLHLDVRSDNLCFRGGLAILVDWNWCSTGNADLDVAAWLPSLAVEGGPQPWEVLPAAGEYAAFLAGVWAALVGLPPPKTAPTVRAGQRRQLEVALAWCERNVWALVGSGRVSSAYPASVRLIDIALAAAQVERGRA